MNLTTDEAQFLIKLQKHMMESIIKLPEAGEKENYPIKDMENLRDFTARVWLSRGTRAGRQNTSYSLFYEKNITLLRLDTDGNGTHVNADGSKMPAGTPHIHLYKEETKDHDAIPIPDSFQNIGDMFHCLLDFLCYANVIDVDKIQVLQQEALPYERTDVHG